jgi:hypothetical protein
MISSMTLARRLCAATMTLVLALFPVALERCRTACLGGSVTPQTATSGHACHDMASDDESVTRLDPMARACGHSDDARTYESLSLLAGKIRTMVLLPAIHPLPGGAQLSGAILTGWPPVHSSPSRVVLPLDLPLRL